MAWVESKKSFVQNQEHNFCNAALVILPLPCKIALKCSNTPVKYLIRFYSAFLESWEVI